jgi:hypothetical protein
LIPFSISTWSETKEIGTTKTSLAPWAANQRMAA